MNILKEIQNSDERIPSEYRKEKTKFKTRK